ncbi:MAG: DUF1836 domain-containing protein, partial [Eubacteriales bacterium]|nr:DUF1836 domain-containing protein [Eubacteriales bacterium]
EITKSMVNNYVKHGLLARPEGKKYAREHLAALLEIAVLKQAMSMESIRALLEILSRGGAQAGYERFCAQVHAMQACVESGNVSLDMTKMSDEEQALCLGIAAAVSTIALKKRLGAAQ